LLVAVEPKKLKTKQEPLSHKTGLTIASDYNTGTNTTVANSTWLPFTSPKQASW